ncbi:MAG: sugar transferase [Planctomycetota bacterium]|nr:sugar transferase [Planctomycetota bacterium]
MKWGRVLLVCFTVTVDCLIIFDAFAVAYLLRFQLQLAPGYYPPEPPLEYLRAMVVVAYFWLLLFKVYGLYDFSRHRSNLDTVNLIVRVVSFGTLIILSLSFFYREFSFSRLVSVYAWGISIVFFALFRIALNRLRSDLFREGRDIRRALLVGSRHLATFLVNRMSGHPELGYRVIGALDDGRPSPQLGCELLGGLKDLEKVVRERQIDRVFIAHSALGHHQLLRVIETCERLGVRLGMVPPTYDLLVNYRDFEEVDGMPLVSVNEQEARRMYDAAKRVLDVAVSLVGIVLLAPFWMVVSLLIRLEDGGPTVFSQTRVGKDGRLFPMLKFRTMLVNAEALLPSLVDIDALEQPVFKLEDDPRVTRVGRLLRRSSLDELPQLINVLRGEMSLVGPRPEEEKVVTRYGVWERRRLKAKPGITGLQQVECRGSVDLKQRVRWDIVYLRKQTLFLDLWICLKTVYVVLVGRGAR